MCASDLGIQVLSWRGSMFTCSKVPEVVALQRSLLRASQRYRYLEACGGDNDILHRLESRCHIRRQCGTNTYLVGS